MFYLFCEEEYGVRPPRFYPTLVWSNYPLRWSGAFSRWETCGSRGAVSADPPRRTGYEHGGGSRGARLAEHVRLQHGALSVVPHGGRDSLRAQPPADGCARRPAHGGAGRGSVAGRG